MMPTLTPSQAIQIGFIVSPALFALCAYFTRACLRRTTSALVGVIAFILVQFAWDRAAALTGWWSYPGYNTSAGMPMPVAIYLLSGMVYAGFGLIGWRIARRYGWSGLLAFLLAWSVWGYIHDTVGSSLFSNSQLMVIGTGIAPLIADFLVYATCMASVLLTMRWIGGPFRSDGLARAPN
jgi:hypothetical protein